MLHFSHTPTQPDAEYPTLPEIDVVLTDDAVPIEKTLYAMRRFLIASGYDPVAIDFYLKLGGQA